MDNSIPLQGDVKVGGGWLDAQLTLVGNSDWPVDPYEQFTLVGSNSLVSLSSLAVKFTKWIMWVTHSFTVSHLKFV